MLPEPLPRLDFLFASKSPLCAILRRGPSKWVHLVKWNTCDDSIECGAWFNGRIYGDRCHLSPDGSLLAYFAARYDREPDDGYTVAWTAVSKPPWLTALALWPQEDTWGGSVYFADASTVVIDCPYWDKLVAHEDHPATQLTALPHWIGKGAPQQDLPQPAESTAFFDAPEGRDQAGRRFWVRDGQLVRDPTGAAPPIADFRAMRPERTRSPKWARDW